jgi:hypothetical protein
VGSKAGRTKASISRGVEDAAFLFLGLGAAAERLARAIAASLANCYEGRYYRQIAPRKGDASPFLNGLGGSETIGFAKPAAIRTQTRDDFIRGFCRG